MMALISITASDSCLSKKRSSVACITSIAFTKSWDYAKQLIIADAY